MKKIILGIILSLLLLSTTGCMRQIEDCNGPDDYSIVTFSDEDKVSSGGYVAIGAISTQVLGKGTFSVKKFSGMLTFYEIDVYEGVTCYFEIDVENGNLEVVLINNNRIIKSLELNTTSRFSIEASGKATFRVIGESAQFKIKYEIEEVKSI